MRRLVTPGALLLGVEHGRVLRADLQTECGVHLADGVTRFGNQAAVVDDGTQRLGVLLQHLERVGVVVKRHLGQRAKRRLHACLVEVVGRPGKLHQLQQARHRLQRVSVENDEARIREHLEQGFDTATEGGVLAQVNAVSAAHVQLAAYALAVEAHQALTLLLFMTIDVVEVEIIEIRQLRHPVARGAGVREHEIVFLGQPVTHPVDVVRRPEDALLARIHPLLQAPAEPARIDCRQPVNRLLLQDRRREQLPVEEGAEALAVGAEQSVHQRGAAARVADHEHRLAHRGLAQPGKQQRIERKADGVEQRYQRRLHQQAQVQAEAPAWAALVRRQPDQPAPGGEIKVKKHSRSSPVILAPVA